ncbi:Ig-like domain-containing protein [Clostridium hydrogenum]|uniref:Ig-like domain-containing protein n=1 Tax=Clostridium hydrogenum TaxID=2855764 RepID=UPI001F2E79EC|nr:glycoside hydrolase [Clostridium hydrogenum]
MFKLKKILPISLALIFASSSIEGIPLTNNTVHASSANIVSIDPSLQYQTMDGWGTSLAWWAKLMGQWKTDSKNQIMDLIFNPDKGLGLNMVRYNIGGATSPKDKNLRLGADIESYELPDGTYDWTKDAGQRWVLEEAKKRIAANEFKAEAFSNSAPYFMTISGQSSGNVDGKSNLKPDQYQNFADYLTNVVQHFKTSLGINFNTLEPMNEPSTNYWKKDGNQEGCDFDSPAEKDTIFKDLSKDLTDKGLNTKLSGFDETSIDVSLQTIKSASKDTISAISQFNTHDYSGSSRTQLRDLAASLGKPLYMDEICTSVGPCDPNYIDSGLAISDYIFKDLRDMKVSGWDIWQSVDDEAGNENNNLNYGLIRAYWSGDNAEKYYITKQYYALAQFSKFIRPGYKIIDANNPDVVAAIDPTSQKLVLVTRNNSTSDKPLNFDLSKFDTSQATIKAYRTSSKESLADISNGVAVKNGALADTLPAKSIATYVISNASYKGEVGTTVNDNVIGTNNNQFNYSNSWSYYSSQDGAYSNDTHYSNTADSYCKFKFDGNRIKLYGACAPDAGIAGISIDGSAETNVDLYSSIRKDNALIYTSKLLPPGSHTVSVRVTGNKNAASSATFVSIDRAVAVQNSTDNITQPKPQLNQVTSRDGSLWIKYTAVDGATSYNIKYGTSQGNYTKVIPNVKDTSYTITGLNDGTKYYISVSATTNGIESANSNELSETPAMPANPNLLYYVNCGDSTPYSLEPGETLGTNNGNEDQPYSLDSLTGYNWGYIIDEGIGWSQDIQASVESNYGCERQYDGTLPQGGLTYKFDVPDGKYLVTMGFYDPWQHSQRLEDIVINGTMVAKALCPNTIGMVPNYYITTTSGGTLTVRAQRSSVTLDGKTDKPLISWIKVEKYTKVDTISFNKNTLSVERGQTATLTPTIKPDNAPYKDVKWSSTDPTIATVNNGVVTALKEGTTKITATSLDNPSAIATCDLTVAPIKAAVPVSSININYSNINMNLNDSLKLTANVLPSNASVKTVTWSSSDEKVVKVSQDGTLTPVGYGTATIKAVSFQDLSTTGTCTVNVVKGYNLLYFVNAGDSDPTVFEAGEDIPKLNSNEDQPYGTDSVTGKKWGYVLSDNGDTWSQNQEDTPGNDKYNCLRQYSGTTEGKGITYKFELPNGSYNIDMGFYDPWNSNGRLEDIVINGKTELTGFLMKNNKVKKSFYNIQVTDGTLSVSVLNSKGSTDNPFLSWISVGNYTPATSVTLNNTSLTLKPGDTSVLTATQNPWQTAAQGQVTWTSSNTKVATVDANGKVTALAPGVSNIIATSVDGGKSAACSVTVLSNTSNSTGTSAKSNSGSTNSSNKTSIQANTLPKTGSMIDLVTLTTCGLLLLLGGIGMVLFSKKATK